MQQEQEKAENGGKLDEHDPNNFEFIRKKNLGGNVSKYSNGKYFYSKKINFGDKEYITIY